MRVEKESSPGRIWARSVVLISLIGPMAGPGCAKVGDPLPPRSQLPPTIRSLKLVQVDDRVQLHFPLAFPETDRIQIHRACPGEDPSMDPVLTLYRRQLRRRDDGDGYRVELELPQDGVSCGYFLRFADLDGLVSLPSNLVRASPVKAAAAPRKLRCAVNSNHLRLEWDRPRSNHDGSRRAKSA